MILAGLGAAALAATPAGPAPAQVAAAIDVALRACEQWVLEPRTHADGPQTFLAKAGLAGRLEPQARAPDAVLPPPEIRKLLRTWRAPLGAGGIFVTVSDAVPICHLAGGGPFDLQPGVVAERNAAAFRKRWTPQPASRRGDMTSVRLTSTADRRMWMLLSHAAAPGARTDRVQFIATAQLDLRN